MYWATARWGGRVRGRWGGVCSPQNMCALGIGGHILCNFTETGLSLPIDVGRAHLRVLCPPPRATNVETAMRAARHRILW